MDDITQVPGGTLTHKGGRLYEFSGEWSEETVAAAPDNLIWVYGDNAARSGLGGQACIRRHPRALGLVTKKSPRRQYEAYFRDEELDDNKVLITKDLLVISRAVGAGYGVVLSDQLYGTGLARLHETAPWTFLWLSAKMNALRAFLTGHDEKKIDIQEKEEVMSEPERLYHADRNERLQKHSDALVTTKTKRHRRVQDDAQIGMF